MGYRWESKFMLKAPALSGQSDNGTLLFLAPVPSQTKKKPVAKGPPALLSRSTAPHVHSTRMYVCTDHRTYAHSCMLW